MLNESELYSYKEHFFEDSTDYILGDSAYWLTNQVIKPYSKKEFDENEYGCYIQFYIHFSSARVKVEHTFGNLKTRFLLMSGLSTVLGSEKGNKCRMHFVFTVCILHNFLLLMMDEWDPTDDDVVLIENNTIDAYNSILQSQWIKEIASE